MPRYQYTAQAGSGETSGATAEAPSLPALAARLAADGKQIKTARELREQIPRIRSVPYFDVIGIYRQVAASIGAGMPLVETLEMLSGESRNSGLKSLLYFLRTQVSTGKQLSEAMKLFPEVFPEVHAAVVRSGEESGELQKALDDLADQAEALSNMNRRFASSLVYPTVIAVAALALFNFGFFAIIPKFQVLFGDLGILDYPTFTKLLFFVARTVAPVTGMVLIGLAVMVVLISAQRKAASGRQWIDAWKLRIPVLGQIIEKAALARFSGILGLLLEAGIDLPRAVRIAAEGTGNRVVERVLKNVAVEVEKGNELGEAMGRAAAMPPTLAWRVGVGEETGSLPDALLRMSRFYAGQVDSLITSLAGLLEPVLIIVIGSGVALLVVGMFLPLVAVIQNLSGGGM